VRHIIWYTTFLVVMSEEPYYSKVQGC